MTPIQVPTAHPNDFDSFPKFPPPLYQLLILIELKFNLTEMPVSK